MTKPKRGLLFALVLAAGFSLGFTYEEVHRRRDVAALPRIGKPIDIGQRSLNLHCAGYGAPPAVLIAGAGTPGVAWTGIEGRIAPFTQTCWADRAGEGWSDPAPFPLTSASDAKDLRDALRNAGVSPPYVLVGHSLGGLDARVFAALYPDDVAGMVLVDSAHEEEPLRAPKAYLGHVAPQWLWHPLHLLFAAAARLGVIRLTSPSPRSFPVGAPVSTEQMVDALRRRPQAIASSASRGLVASTSYSEAHAAPGIGNRPLIVLTRGKSPKPSGDPTFDRDVAAYENAWQHEMQPQFLRLSTNSRQIIVRESGHMIPEEAPDVVISAVREIVAGARSGATLQ